MILPKTTYSPITLICKFRYLISFCLLFLLLTKTVIHKSFEFQETNYELTDSSEKENSSENETNSEDENITYNIKKIGNTTDINQPRSYFILNQSFWNLNIDIQVPPPRI